MSRAAESWTETYHVRSYEADPNGCASMQTLCNYLQEAAGNHAEVLGFSVEHLAGHNLTWVLAYLHVQVDVYPRWREGALVETWPSGENGLYATREFLLRGSDTQSLGRATSAWLLIDLARRRPVRIPDIVRQVCVPERARPLPGPVPRLKPPERIEHERTFHVRLSDLDMNQHVNNVRYIDWALESIPQETCRGYRLEAVEISFRSETLYGDTITAQVQQAEEDAGRLFIHRLVNARTAQDVALARTRWRPT